MIGVNRVWIIVSNYPLIAFAATWSIGGGVHGLHGSFLCSLACLPWFGGGGSSDLRMMSLTCRPVCRNLQESIRMIADFFF
jgi:hypothetical protein